MVILQIKRGAENLFLYETSIKKKSSDVIKEITAIHNGRLKINRICVEIEELASHGAFIPPEMIGLSDEIIQELQFQDIWAETCMPTGGFIFNKDPVGRRNGKQPTESMQNLLRKACSDAQDMISEKLVDDNIKITLKTIALALNLLQAAVSIVYPMQLPPYDTICREFNNENLNSKEEIQPLNARLWFGGYQILPNKRLKDFLGSNDKNKFIVKLGQLDEGPPDREPDLTEDLHARLLTGDAVGGQEDLNKIKLKLDYPYLNSSC